MVKVPKNGILEHDGFLQAPVRMLMTALCFLECDPRLPSEPLQEYIEAIAACRRESGHPGLEHDRLFLSSYVHDATHATCDSCSLAHVVLRPVRSSQHPRIHYGLIASGNQVMKAASLRDKWGREREILRSEMEAAGIINTLSCLVIRGICDYSDSHTRKDFQIYAAATVTSFAKLLLCYLNDCVG
ncbi:Uncharacterized protein PECH_001250 [Penicillium ucsense]|uniref:Nucleoside phosphorylase domain-containing protein n=1 Tax=Penicillium ucsense TaxID=2839758 RepID=A0A8J8WFR3_9EURO|nr:Uncharacterized protein PECM_001023 [Penicillium ucsense]KAF7733042.1 Uncharacterized protein PECH_001250 [Penicillium ucsense]